MYDQGEEARFLRASAERLRETASIVTSAAVATQLIQIARTLDDRARQIEYSLFDPPPKQD